MLWTIAIIFGLLWVLGIVTAYTLGGAIHALLAVAVVLLLVGTFRAGAKSGRRQRGAAPSRPPVPRATAGGEGKGGANGKAPLGGTANAKRGRA